MSYWRLMQSMTALSLYVLKRKFLKYFSHKRLKFWTPSLWTSWTFICTNLYLHVILKPHASMTCFSLLVLTKNTLKLFLLKPMLQFELKCSDPTDSWAFICTNLTLHANMLALPLRALKKILQTFFQLKRMLKFGH